MTAENKLRDFELPLVAHGGIFGVFLAAHAVADGLQVLHTGVGCKGKTQRQIVFHDLGAEAHTKVGWTELAEEDLIRDAATPFLRAASELHRRREPGIMLVCASTAVEYTGVDFPALVHKLESETGCPAVWIPGAGAADLATGYAAAVRALVGRVDWSREPAGGKPVVSLAGVFFHRHEMEQAANLAELRRMIESLGGSPGPVFFDGGPWAALQQAHRARLLVALPHAGQAAEELAAATGRKAVETSLPMGLGATADWLRRVGTALEVPPDQIESVIARGEERLAPRLALARRKLAGRSLALVADTPHAAGWIGVALELGMKPALVALTNRSPEGRDGLACTLEQSGLALPASLEVLESPTLQQLRNIDPCGFDLAVRPDLDLTGTPWTGIPAVETGFPSNRKHFVHPLPELGHAGTAAVAQRLLDAVMQVH